jgi:hypothetical protein
VQPHFPQRVLYFWANRQGAPLTLRAFPSFGQLIVKHYFAVEQLVHLAASRGIEQDDLLAARQPLTQVDLDVESRPPGQAFLGLALDIDVDPFWRDPLARCDRSDGQRDSTAQ